MKTIYMIRHGQTYINQFNKIQGWSDAPLTEKGREQAQKMGRILAKIKFDAAISSDTKRASQTAKLIIRENKVKQNLKLIQSSYFREQYYGFFEGMDAEQAWFLIGGPHHYPTRFELLRKEPIDTVKNWMHQADPYHVAEDAHTYWHRIDKGLEQIKKMKKAKKILLVNHGFNIRSFAAKFGNHIDIGVSPRNGSVTILQMDQKHIKVLAYNLMNLGSFSAYF